MADDPTPPSKAEKAAKWREDQEKFLADRAAERRSERERLRAENRASWSALRESDVAASSLAREQGRARRSAEWAERQSPAIDPFIADMAARFRHTDVTGIPGYSAGDVSCTPDEFIAFQQRQRERMAHPQTQEEIDEVMRRAR